MILACVKVYEPNPRTIWNVHANCHGFVGSKLNVPSGAQSLRRMGSIPPSGVCINMPNGKAIHNESRPSAHMEKQSHLTYVRALRRHLVDFRSYRRSLRVSIQSFPRYKVTFLRLNGPLVLETSAWSIPAAVAIMQVSQCLEGYQG